jgi:hypothetical protein
MGKQKVGAIAAAFYWIAIFFVVCAFATLFSRVWNYTIPIISDWIVPAFYPWRITVDIWDATGRSDTVSAEDWVFLLLIIIAGLFLILGALTQNKK